jgi:hypothetical protein
LKLGLCTARCPVATTHITSEWYGGSRSSW